MAVWTGDALVVMIYYACYGVLSPVIAKLLKIKLGIQTTVKTLMNKVYEVRRREHLWNKTDKWNHQEVGQYMARMKEANECECRNLIDLGRVEKMTLLSVGCHVSVLVNTFLTLFCR